MRDMSRSLAAAFAVVLATLALVACGDESDEPTTTVTETVTSEPEPAPEEEADPQEPAAATGPVGPLRRDGIGSLDFGTPQDAVEQAFGAPDDKQEVNFGEGDAPRVDWLYDDAPGVRIIFDTARGELAGYQCQEGCALETEDGFGIGDPIADVKAKYGSELEDYAIGAGSLILPSGEDQIDGGLVFAASREGKGKLISLAAFDTIAGPAGD